MNFPIPWQERLCRSLRGTRKERRNRSLRVSLLGTLFKQVKAERIWNYNLTSDMMEFLILFCKIKKKSFKFICKTFNHFLSFMTCFAPILQLIEMVKTNFQVAMVHTKMLELISMLWNVTPIPAIFNLNGETLSIERVSPFKLKIAGIGVTFHNMLISSSILVCTIATWKFVFTISINCKIGAKHVINDKKWLKVLQINLKDFFLILQNRIKNSIMSDVRL